MSEWISVDEELPPRHDYNTLCRIMFDDGDEALSNLGTVIDTYFVSGTITHWRY